jgi:hypothetical protein
VISPNVYKPRRFKNGKLYVSRLYRGKYRLDDDVLVTNIPLKTPDKQIAEERLKKIIQEKQREAEGIIAPKGS